MVTFACDDKKIETELRRLHRLVVENGGEIYDGLTIGCEKGSFRITCDYGRAEGHRIMALPKSCLLPVEKFKLDLDGNDIVIRGYDRSLSRGQVAMMRSMMKLYNLTDKVAMQKKIATMGLYYADPDLFKLIVKHRGRAGIPFLDKMALMGRRQFYLESFIKTRVLGFREEGKSAAKAKRGQGKKITAAAADAEAAPRVPVLMPLIDFLNHHPHAAGFFTSFRDIPGARSKKRRNGMDENAQGSDGVAVVKSCPFAQSSECYVCYGPYDATDAFLNYNYVERHANFARSVPLRVDLPGGGTIAVQMMAGRVKFGKLPDKVKDLKFYLPSLTYDESSRTVTLSSLLIPQAQAPYALRRVLGLAINKGGFARTDDELTRLIKFVEKRVIQENLRHYRELSAYLEMHRPKAGTALIVENARAMAATQLEKVENYPLIGEILPNKLNKPKKAAER